MIDYCTFGAIDPTSSIISSSNDGRSSRSSSSRVVCMRQGKVKWIG